LTELYYLELFDVQRKCDSWHNSGYFEKWQRLD
jgi:hypothetical protein